MAKTTSNSQSANKKAATKKTANTAKRAKRKNNEAVTDATTQHIMKFFGKGKKIKKASAIKQKKSFHSGYKEIDNVISAVHPGIPLGILAELYGPEGGGKSVMCARFVASAQKQGLTCVWFDAEHQFNPHWMQLQGVDLDNLYIEDENLSAEETLDAINAYVMSGKINLAIVDSVASLIPKSELEGSIGDKGVAEMGRVMSKAMRKINAVAAVKGCTVIFVNQLREKIGVLFGNPETTPGGRALKFYSSLRLRIYPAGGKAASAIEKEGEKIGIYTKVHVTKNRFGMPDGHCDIPIYFIDYSPTGAEEAMRIAKDLKVVKKYKGRMKYDKIDAETLFELLEAIVESNRLEEFCEKLEEAAKIAELELEELVTDFFKEVKEGVFELGEVNAAALNAKTSKEKMGDDMTLEEELDQDLQDDIVEEPDSGQLPLPKGRGLLREEQE